MRYLPLLIGAVVISGCVATEAPATVPTAPVLSEEPSTKVPSASPTGIAGPTPGSVSTARPDCLLGPGSIAEGELESPELTRSLPYRVYLPPCYEAARADGYPVLYLLHGLSYDDSQWDDLGVDEAATALIRSGGIPPILIVMPSERTGQDLELAIAESLIPFVDSRYQTLDDRSGRAIGGLSRGAGWALRIGLKHPSLFSAVGLHSPAVLPPDLYDLPAWLKAFPPADRPRLWIDAGEKDPLKPSILELVKTLEAAGYDFSWSLMPGDHSAVYWTAHLQDYLRWYARDW